MRNFPLLTEDFYKALSFAVKAHDGNHNKYKRDEPYVLHPIAVAEAVNTNDEKILALLHDVIEDTNATYDDIKELGFEHLIDALKCLTKIENESDENYIGRILKNRLAVKVKIADMKHNLSRADDIPECERWRADKYIKWLPVLEAEKNRIRIIAAHAGTGKTTLANRYPERFTDFICMPYKYHLSENFDENENESCKANPDNELHIDWPDNYFEAILAELNKNDKMLIIPPDWRIKYMLQAEELRYFLCYPENTEESKEVYRKRYVDRGNTENFMEIFIDGWDEFMDSFENDSYGEHIVLKPHQYLTDVVDEFKDKQSELI